MLVVSGERTEDGHWGRFIARHRGVRLGGQTSAIRIRSAPRLGHTATRCARCLAGSDGFDVGRPTPGKGMSAASGDVSALPDAQHDVGLRRVDSLYPRSVSSRLWRPPTAAQKIRLCPAMRYRNSQSHKRFGPSNTRNTCKWLSGSIGGQEEGALLAQLRRSGQAAPLGGARERSSGTVRSVGCFSVHLHPGPASERASLRSTWGIPRHVCQMRTCGRTDSAAPSKSWTAIAAATSSTRIG